MYEIEYTEEAAEDLAYFQKHEQQIIVNGIEQQLRYQPTIETRNRFRRTPPDLASWELRIGIFRVYYNVDDTVRIVDIERIGEKPNNEIYFRGRKAGRS